MSIALVPEQHDRWESILGAWARGEASTSKLAYERLTHVWDFYISVLGWDKADPRWSLKLKHRDSLKVQAAYNTTRDRLLSRSLPGVTTGLVCWSSFQRQFRVVQDAHRVSPTDDCLENLKWEPSMRKLQSHLESP